MTVVIAIITLIKAMVIADSRVSWEDNRCRTQDILRKLYTIDLPFDLRFYTKLRGESVSLYIDTKGLLIPCEGVIPTQGQPFRCI